ncbi:hypothetical protein KDW55_26950 [Burkholderia sp. AU19243]|nr:hypothetical protein [Burkholderia sp. AU19243]
MAPAGADGAIDMTVAAGGANVAGRDIESGAVYVMPAIAGAAATVGLAEPFACAGAAEAGALPTDDAPAANAASATEEGSAGSDCDGWADAGALPETDSVVAETAVDGAGAGTHTRPVADGAARCGSAGGVAVSPSSFAAALETVPVRASAGAAPDAGSGAAAIPASGIGIVSPTARAGVAVVDEAGRGGGSAAGSAGFTRSVISSVPPIVSADAKESAG